MQETNDIQGNMSAVSVRYHQLGIRKKTSPGTAFSG
jgi:hypothetical protein